MTRLLDGALLAAAAVLAALGVFVIVFGNSAPASPRDGVAVEGLLRAGAFGALRPGDVRRLQVLVRPTDRFVVVGDAPRSRYGDPLKNARLLLGSLLMPAVMTTSCERADVVISLRSGRTCKHGMRVAAIFPSGVALYRS
jgi:hypothetical protein